MRHFVSMMAMLLAVCSFAQAPRKVAVYVTGDVDDSYKKVIGSKLVSGITQSGEYAAVERTNEFLSALTQEQDYQMSGAVNDQQIVKLGAQFGVRYVLVADVTEIFESTFISARMIDVQTGLITHSADVEMELYSTKDLITITEAVIGKIFGGIGNDKLDRIGPIKSMEELRSVTIPDGYRICTAEEIRELRRQGKEVLYPVIVEIMYNYYEAYRYSGDERDYYTDFKWLEENNILKTKRLVDKTWVAVSASSEYTRYSTYNLDGVKDTTPTHHSNMQFGEKYGYTGVQKDILTSSPAYIYIIKSDN